MDYAERPVGDPKHVPEAWPLLLSKEQLCAYIGVSTATLTRICPVRPLDLGANVVRYSRPQIEDWVATLPPRLIGRKPDALPVDAEVVQDAAAAPSAENAEDRPMNAIERARARVSKGPTRWRKTG